MRGPAALARLVSGKVVRPWPAPSNSAGRFCRGSYSRRSTNAERQNRAGQPGRYRFYHCHGWLTRLLPNGAYRIEVEAADISGNHARASLPITIAN